MIKSTDSASIVGKVLRQSLLYIWFMINNLIVFGKGLRVNGAISDTARNNANSLHPHGDAVGFQTVFQEGVQALTVLRKPVTRFAGLANDERVGGVATIRNGY